MPENIAVIDLGSNSARMNIYAVEGEGNYRLIDQYKEMVRLSEGMSADMRLKPLPKLRTMAALRTFRAMIDRWNVEKIHAVATAALRHAVDRDEYLRRIYEETGLRFDVLSGLQEAALACLGVLNTLPERDFLMMDTGGASTELALIKGRQLHFSQALPVGAVSLSEQYQDNQSRLSRTDRGLDEVNWLSLARGGTIVALGGTARAMGRMMMLQTRYQYPGLHGYAPEVADARRMIQRILEADLARRRQMLGMDPSRADTLDAGLCPLARLIDRLEPQRVVFSDAGLREGLLYRALYGSEPLPDPFEESARALILRYRRSLPRAYAVREFAEKLFSALQEAHGLDASWLRPLGAAALLHDIGQAVDYVGHEKHGCYLMMNAPLYGLTHIERCRAAALLGARRLEQERQNLFGAERLLTDGDFERLPRAAMLLKFAEEINRSAPVRLDGVSCYSDRDAIHILMHAEDCGGELAAAFALRLGGLCRRIFGKNLIVV